jgi:hypothetical protein
MRSAERQKRARHTDEDRKHAKYWSKREQDTEHNSEDEFSSAFHRALNTSNEIKGQPWLLIPRVKCDANALIMKYAVTSLPNGGKFLCVPAPRHRPARLRARIRTRSKPTYTANAFPLRTERRGSTLISTLGRDHPVTACRTPLCF